MLTDLAVIFLLGLCLSGLMNKLHIPPLVGMLLTGILLGPFGFNLLSSSILAISADLRQLALIIILTRAGFALDINQLKQVGRPAFLICFVPACFEIVGVMLFAPPLLNISLIDAAIMGAVIAAVSPAVIVPKMLHLTETGYGTNKSIPQMIMAGASVDDIFVIVLFSAFTGIAQGGSLNLISFFQIPCSIIVGCILGIIIGLFSIVLFKKVQLRGSVKVVVILSFSFLLVALEAALKGKVAVSGLLAIMAMGATIQKKNPDIGAVLSRKYSKLWAAAEILLFALVGATVDLQYAAIAGITSILVILGAMVFRMFGVYLCMTKTVLNFKERIFCMIAYMPKATVQAAIGSIPLAMGLSCGKVVLTVAVLAILITAPLGAFGIDISYRKLLTKE
ncbi:MAG: cation:proton antiporter [Oscillospiraceae bacterium]